MTPLDWEQLTEKQRRAALSRAAVVLAIQLGDERVENLARRADDKGDEASHCLAAALRWLVRP